MTVRTRLDALTQKLWDGIDNALNKAAASPPPNDSIDGLNADLDTVVADIATAQSELTPITDAIAVITAIPAGSRTQAQKDRLTDLRVTADQQRRQIRVVKQQASNLRVLKTLTRQGIVTARFAMMLDGGPARVRAEDVDGSE